MIFLLIFFLLIMYYFINLLFVIILSSPSSVSYSSSSSSGIKFDLLLNLNYTLVLLKKELNKISTSVYFINFK